MNSDDGEKIPVTNLGEGEKIRIFIEIDPKEMGEVNKENVKKKFKPFYINDNEELAGDGVEIVGVENDEDG